MSSLLAKRYDWKKNPKGKSCISWESIFIIYIPFHGVGYLIEMWKSEENNIITPAERREPSMTRPDLVERDMN